jgi:hypothetical protein
MKFIIQCSGSEEGPAEVEANFARLTLSQYKELFHTALKRDSTLLRMAFYDNSSTFYVNEDEMPSRTLSPREQFVFDERGYWIVSETHRFPSRYSDTRLACFCCSERGFWWEAFIKHTTIKLFSQIIPWSILDEPSS